MSHSVALLNVTESAALFGVSVRTILRKIKDNSISDTQIVRDGRETKIYVNELVRVFGEPKTSINGGKQDVSTSHTETRHAATRAKDVAYPDPRDAHIATLKDQIERERERADREREKLEAQVRAATERADRYEREAEEQRHVTEALRQKLLEAPKPRGILARLFGG